MSNNGLFRNLGMCLWYVPVHELQRFQKQTSLRFFEIKPFWLKIFVCCLFLYVLYSDDKNKKSYSRIFPLQINKKQTWYNNCTIIQTFCWSLKVLIFLLPGYYFQLTDLRVGLSVYYVIITFGFIPLMYLMQKIYIAQFSFRILTAKHLFWEVKINIKENK
jgi:hypothetical protein